MKAIQFKSGQILFEEGEFGQAAFIIKSGSVELSRKTHSGWSKHVAYLEEGNIIGEMSLIEDEPHSVTATAREDGEALILSREAYQERSAKSDRVIRMILKRFSEKLRKTY